MTEVILRSEPIETGDRPAWFERCYSCGGHGARKVYVSDTGWAIFFPTAVVAAFAGFCIGLVASWGSNDFYAKPDFAGRCVHGHIIWNADTDKLTGERYCDPWSRP